MFPVAKTAIGNLAAIASEKILYPEVARCLAMRGAEIFYTPHLEYTIIQSRLKMQQKSLVQ